MLTDALYYFTSNPSQRLAIQFTCGHPSWLQKQQVNLDLTKKRLFRKSRRKHHPNTAEILRPTRQLKQQNKEKLSKIKIKLIKTRKDKPKRSKHKVVIW